MSQKKESIKYPVLTSPFVGNLTVTKEAKRKIDQLHKSVGNVEWAGFITYDKVSGSLSDPQNLVLKVIDVYPMSIGSHSYVEAENHSDDMLDLYDRVPSFMTSRYGLIHTHHTMNTFFSGTDIEELHENADKYSAYLSLIVNIKEEYSAKIVSLVKSSPRILSIEEEGEDTKNVEFSDGNVHMLMIDLKVSIEREYEEDQVLSDRIVELQNRKKKNAILANPQTSLFSTPENVNLKKVDRSVSYSSQYDMFDTYKSQTVFAVNKPNAVSYLVKLMCLDDEVNDVGLYQMLMEVAKDEIEYPDYIGIFYQEVAEEAYNMAAKMVGYDQADALIELAIEKLSDYEKDPKVLQTVVQLKMILSAILKKEMV